MQLVYKKEKINIYYAYLLFSGLYGTSLWQAITDSV